MYGAIYRCAGRFQNATDPERLFIVLYQSDTSSAVCDHDFLTNFIAELSCYLTTNNRIEYILKTLATGETQQTLIGVSVMFEVIVTGTQHAIPGMRITQRYRYDPINCLTFFDFLDTLPADVTGRITDPENRIQQ